jgi:hypothetical protein
MRIRQHAATWLAVLGLSCLVSAARAELPFSIPYDPVTCQNELANREPKLAVQDRNDLFRCKPDFARLEHEHPLTHKDLGKIMPTDLMAQQTTQEQVDQIYARLTAGSIPNGFYDVRVFRRVGGVRFEDYTNIAGPGGQGLDLLLRTPMLETILPLVWRGKVFESAHRIVRTQLFGFKVLPRLFPAKVYCGQSLLDGRRESIILDYTFSETLPGYHSMIDRFMGHQWLQVRDEVRMVRPGLYLGRVYMGRIFVFNVILYQPDLLTEPPDDTAWNHEDCHVGLQRQAARR